MAKIQNYRKLGGHRGVGAIMGGVILIAILITTVLLYYVTILNNDQRKASYEIQSAQINDDKAAENLLASLETELEPCPTNPSDDCIRTDIKNAGSLPLIVSHSAVYCTDCSPITDELVKRGITLSAQEGRTIYIPVSSSSEYKIDYITERGNLANAGVCDVNLVLGECINNPGSGSDPDFILTASPGALLLKPGNSDTAELVVTSLNGYVGTVDLSASSSTSDIQVLPASIPPVVLTANDYVETTLTINTSSSITDGNYLLTLTGTDGSLTRQTTINVAIFTTQLPEEPREDDSIIKPQIQGIFPNPHGALSQSSDNQGLWGVVVANPSDADMTVRRVVITTYSPDVGLRVFPKDSNVSTPCPHTPILPTLGGAWSCPAQNTLTWIGTTVIPARSAGSFLVTVGGPVVTGNSDVPSFAINFNVFTTFGQYAKAGYASAMAKDDKDSEIASVYLTTTNGSIAPSSMIGTITVNTGQVATVRATIANLGDADGVIKAGSKLIVVVPKAFTNVAVPPIPPAGFISCIPVALGDGQTQITCTLSSDLPSEQARTLQFTMTAPTITSSKLYPLLVLADGADSNSAPMGAVGPVSENVVVVEVP